MSLGLKSARNILISMAKIITYNINGLRAGIKKGFLDWLKDNDFDIVCLQETKARKNQIPVELLEDLGYHHYWHSAEKAGYSGVATLTKRAPDLVVEGCGIEKYDREGRILRLDFGDWSLLNCYFPSGSSGDERHAFKMEYLKDFQNWINELKKERPKLIIVGDYNIVHTELDIHNPDRRDKPSGYKPEERQWMTDWLNSGFVDAFRYKHPEEVIFSWWSFRARSRERNKGWRIDYQSVSENLKDKIIDSAYLNDVVHSDHCPQVLEMDF